MRLRCAFAGNLTVSQLYTVLPDDQVALANASGDTVIKLFARAVQDMTVDASSSKTFLQVSGESPILQKSSKAHFWRKRFFSPYIVRYRIADKRKSLKLTSAAHVIYCVNRLR